MIKKTIHIMMGLPGSGKTTYVEEHTALQPNHRVISLDNEYYGKRDPINYAAQYAVDYVKDFLYHSD